MSIQVFTGQVDELIGKNYITMTVVKRRGRAIDQMADVIKAIEKIQ